MKLNNYIPNGNLSTDLVHQIRILILNNDIQEGERINEVQLSQTLGISRTPLREALTRLLADGVLEAIPRRGFFVTRLSVEEFRDIYPMRAILDPIALELSGIPSTEEIEILEKKHSDLMLQSDPLKIIALDDDWHLTLVKNCKNTEIIKLITHYMRRTYRYEYGLLKTQSNVDNMHTIHADILMALKGGQLQSACNMLKHNMQHGIEPIINWLKSRDIKQEK